MDSIQLTICRVDRSRIPSNAVSVEGLPDYQFVAAVTWLPDNLIMKTGLPRGSICGVLANTETDHPISTTNFLPNRDFINVLHYLNTNCLDPDLQDYAARTTEKRIAIIDQRSPDVNAAIPTEDIIGVYDVENHQVIRYHANPNYRLVSDRGIFKLTPWLRHCLVQAVIPKQ